MINHAKSLEGEAALYDALDQQLLLAARPPSRLQRRIACCVVACLVAIFCITVPFARLPLQPIAAFVPIYATVILINDLITAALIVAQFWVARQTWLLVLAGGYFFTALIIIPNALTVPGVFAPAGLLGAGMQTAGWISACWHLVSPLVLIAAMLVRRSHATTGMGQRSPGLAIVLGIVLVAAFVCGVTWAVIACDEYLPKVYADRVNIHHNIIPIVGPMIALNIIAFVTVWRSGRSVLDLWLMIMCCIWLFEVTLGGILAGSRYSLGWYTGRIFELAATFIVLLLFLSEKTALYANLARSAIQRRGARHARQIAMDATAASIGHEIKQPLTAVLANVEAGLRQLTWPEPDLNELRATLSDIGADSRRINDIIGGVRMMFKESTHDRQLLNLNKVVQDVLAMVQPELRHQRVIVRRALDDDLPPVLADSGQMHQVFLNLVTNALEAMSAVAGRPSVLRVTSSIVAGSSDVAVTVEDTGVGIADENGDRIFEPFFSTKAAGTGIGLSICQVIIEAHDGKLQVCANEPCGTIFRVILPRGSNE